MGAVPTVGYSLLDPEFLSKEVARRYELGQPAGARLQTPAYIRFYSRGSNDVYDFTAGDSTFVLRVSPAIRSSQSVAMEVGLLAEMDQAGLSVVAPVPASSQDLFFTVSAPEGDRQCVVFPHVGGRMGLPLNDTGLGRAIGVAVGAFHRWGDSEYAGETEADPTPALDESFSWMDVYAGDPQLSQIKDLAQCATEMCRDMGGSDVGLCHGDMVGGNTICDSGRAWLFDFEYCGHGDRCYDIATLKDSIEPDTHDAVWAAFLDGYRTERDLTDELLKQLPAQSIYRQLWLMQAHHRIAMHWGWVWGRDRMVDNVARLQDVCDELASA